MLVIKSDEMKTPNRDLLVLVKHALDDNEAMERELNRLNGLLMDVETSATFSRVFEVIDCNKLKVFCDTKRIMQTITQGEKGFIFLCNKN